MKMTKMTIWVQVGVLLKVVHNPIHISILLYGVLNTISLELYGNVIKPGSLCFYYVGIGRNAY